MHSGYHDLPVFEQNLITHGISARWDSFPKTLSVSVSVQGLGDCGEQINWNSSIFHLDLTFIINYHVYRNGSWILLIIFRCPYKCVGVSVHIWLLLLAVMAALTLSARKKYIMEQHNTHFQFSILQKPMHQWWRKTMQDTYHSRQLAPMVLYSYLKERTGSGLQYILGYRKSVLSLRLLLKPSMTMSSHAHKHEELKQFDT